MSRASRGGIKPWYAIFFHPSEWPCANEAREGSELATPQETSPLKSTDKGAGF
jgi:hypothetical protein